MEWMRLCLNLIYVIFLLSDGNSIHTVAKEVVADSDNCVISVIIPKESVKTTCSDSSKTEFKLRSVEGIISQLRRDINDLKVKLAYTLSPKSDTKEITDLNEKVDLLKNEDIFSIQARLSILEERFDTIGKSKQLVDKDLIIAKKPSSTFLKNLSRKKLSKIVKTIVTKELSGLEDKIKTSLMEEIQSKQGLSVNGRSKANLKRETVTANSQSDRLYRQYSRQDISLSPKSHVNVHEGADIPSRLDKVMPKIAAHDSLQSAIDNEFPGVHGKIDVAQSDSEFGNGMTKLFEILRSELTDTLKQQTKMVKDITSLHVSTIESKMARLVRVIEGMKNKYDKKFVPHHHNHNNSDKLQNKIQELENHISTLAQGIASMKENLFNDPVMEERFIQQQVELENKITSKIYQSEIPSKRELENIRTQLKEANRKVELTDANFRNYRADMRIKTHFLEHNMTELVGAIEQLNESVFPDYEDAANIDELRHEVEVSKALRFIKDMKDIWPSIVHNVTEKDLMDENDRQEIELELSGMKTSIKDLSEKDDQIDEKISSLNQTINSLTDRITDTEVFNLKNALGNTQWVRYDFNCSYRRTHCLRGKKYIRKTKYSPAEFVGVVLCSKHRYKIYLGDSLDSPFLDLGDTYRGGEDHCEFVGASKGSKIRVGRGDPIFDPIKGYKRSDWGQNPSKGTLSFYTPTPPWYECGVTIP